MAAAIITSSEPSISSDTPSLISAQRIPVTVTTSTSLGYVQACARSNQTASRHSSLTLLFEAEKLPPLSNEPLIPHTDRSSMYGCDILRARLAKLSNDEIEGLIYDTAVFRMTAKCKNGGTFIAEAGGFAAVTGWEPMYAPIPPPDWESKYGLNSPDFDLSEEIDKLESNGVPMSKIIRERPLFGHFWMEQEKSKYKHLYPLMWRAAQSKNVSVSHSDTDESAPQEYKEEHLKYWYICLTSRNPAVQPPVPGAVRAVVEPILKRLTEEEGIPAVWILAANERARDVYGYFGFRVVDKIFVGKDEFGEDIASWCMMYTRDG